MVNQQIVDWIKNQVGKGYSSQQLQDYLIQQGYNTDEVAEAINSITQIQPAPKKSNKLLMIIIISVVIIAIVAASYWFLTRPVCGNGILEEGETIETCCLDAGCLGEQACEENVCIEPTCGACQYLENHACKSYACCSNSDCDDNNADSTDTCENPSAVNAKCTYVSHVELTETGVDVIVGLGRTANFEFEQETHTISVEDVSGDTVTILISSEPKRITMSMTDTKTVDLDGDGVDDISLLIFSVDNGKFHIRIKKLVFKCVQDSDCDDRSPKSVDTCLNPATASARCQYTASACATDSDCEDNNPGTIDKCRNPGTVEASCTNTEVSECSDDDDCDDEDYTTKDRCKGTTIKRCIYTDIDMTDCEEDIDCFIEASEDCDSAMMTYTLTINLFGVIQETTSDYEIRGMEDDRCLLHSEYDEIDISYSENLTQTMLDNNMTQAEINAGLEDLNDQYDEFDGKQTLCRYPVSNLTSMLEGWKVGTFSFSTDDKETYDCTGNAYDVVIT